MKVGITVWGKRISPVFDAALTLLIVDIEGNRVVGRQFLSCRQGGADELIRLLVEAGAQVLICGAISREPARLIEMRGIQLVPFIAGRVDHVLEMFAAGSSIICCRMPGSHVNGHGGRCRCRRGDAQKG
jgi:predicted Fe-Mo cluster-binding NifX family protein